MGEFDILHSQIQNLLNKDRISRASFAGRCANFGEVVDQRCKDLLYKPFTYLHKVYRGIDLESDEPGWRSTIVGEAYSGVGWLGQRLLGLVTPKGAYYSITAGTGVYGLVNGHTAVGILSLAALGVGYLAMKKFERFEDSSI